MKASYLCLIDVAVEDQVVHISYGGNCGTVVEGVGHGYGVTNLYRNVQNKTGNCGTDKGGTSALV